MAEHGTETTDTPSPRRRRRWPYVLVVLLAGAGAVGVTWGTLLSREGELAEMVAQVAGRGQALAWSDFAPEPVPAGRNAAVLHAEALRRYRRVFGLGGAKAPQPDANTEKLAGLVWLLNADPATHPNLRREHVGDVRQVLALGRTVLAPCRQARRCSLVDWCLRFDGPARTCGGPNVTHCVAVAKLLCLEAVTAAERGNAPEAVELLRDAMGVARSVESIPLLRPFLFAAGIRQRVCLAVEQVAPMLSTGRADVPASPDVVGLTEDLRAPDRFSRAMMGERSFVYDTAERVRSGETSLADLAGGSGGLVSRLRDFHPGLLLPCWYVSDEIELLARMTRHSEAAAARSYPAAEARRAKPLAVLCPDAPGPLAWAMFPRLDRAYLRRFGDVAMRRLAAAALAIRMYELDHGRRPDDLTSLVPKYLSLVPVDPFARDSRAVGYAPDAPKPVLYSVYRGGKDDGGRYGTENGYVLLRKSPDLVFFLNGDRPDGEPDPQEPGRAMPAPRMAGSRGP